MNLKKTVFSLLLAFPLCLSAAELPPLPVSKEYVTGYLDNGVKYYIVENGEKKGFADYALVRRSYDDAILAREDLVGCRHFHDRTPFEFLAENGIAYSRNEGFIRYRESSVTYRFQNVPVFNQSVRDSTLLLLMDIANKPGSAPAVVIVGDVQAAKLIERLKVISMLVPAVFDDPEPEKYIWNSCPEPIWNERRTGYGQVARVEFVYRNSRTPRKLMNTVHPVIFRFMSQDFGEILKRRVGTVFYKRNIPVTGLAFRHRDSSRESGDEEFSLSFWTVPDSLGIAVGLVSSVLGSLDKYGISVPEYVNAHDFNIAAFRRMSYKTLSNKEYVDRCLSAFLYNGHLASVQDIRALLDSKSIGAERENVLFNGFVSALLDSAANLSVNYSIPDSVCLHKQELQEVFDSCWKVARKDEGLYVDKEPKFAEPAGKVKLVAATAEPISGGVLWTFSNGMKVIYKNSEGLKSFEYALLIRKGFMEIPGINPGENAFIPDLFSRRRVAGVSGRTFSNFLSRNCISMDCNSSISDFTLSGSAPSEQLPVLLSSLVAVANTGQVDSRGISRYKSGEMLRGMILKHSTSTINAKMDSLVRPGYLWNSPKDINNFREDLPQRAGLYFDKLFSNLSDGVLIICGNLDETVLRKELCRYLGGFRTLKVRSSRPLVQAGLSTGSIFLAENSVSSPGGQLWKGVNVEISAAIPASMQSLICGRLARLAIERELVKELADKGAWVETSGKVDFYPSDRMSIFINCGSCRRDGVPAGVEPATPDELLEAVRKVTDRLKDVNVSDIEALKAMLLGSYSNTRGSRSAIVSSVLCRYSDGRDVVTGFERELKSVTAESVSKILSEFDSGAKVEYVIR